MMFAIRENSKILLYFAPRATILNLEKKITEIVSTGFLTIFRMPLPASLCDAQEPT